MARVTFFTVALLIYWARTADAVITGIVDHACTNEETGTVGVIGWACDLGRAGKGSNTQKRKSKKQLHVMRIRGTNKHPFRPVVCLVFKDSLPSLPPPTTCA